MQATMCAMVSVAGLMTAAVIEAQLNLAARPETAERIASFKKNLFDYLEESDSLDVFSKQFPSVSREQAVAVLEQARASLVPDAHPA